MKAPTQDLLEVERSLLDRGDVVVGIDEVGRGALAGPLTVGAVVIHDDLAPPVGLNDSKLLTPAQRTALVDPLTRWAGEWALGSASAHEIDEWGLRLALAVAATRALNGLTTSPTHALIDGSFNLLRSPIDVRFGATAPPPLRYAALPATTIIRGDRQCATIAAAAVLAKVHRDALMVSLHDEFREYQWAQNKGYGAPEHLEALRRRGPSSHHRTTWNLPQRREP
ncbi:MAG TPA: ribonuclease HII [Acidimicrobiales bacterium]|nr:ribonuclease HII [Acidimicrobiales bacterium]